jgi:hypothetical protein
MRAPRRGVGAVAAPGLAKGRRAGFTGDDLMRTGRVAALFLVPYSGSML